MHTAEDSAAIAIRILQNRERERPVEAAERRLEAALADSRNEAASWREYAAGLEANLTRIYEEMAQPTMSLRPRGIGRRLVRFTGVALLGAVGILAFQMTTPLGAKLTNSLRKQSLGALAADISLGIRHQFQSPTSHAPAALQPTPAPVVVQEPKPAPVVAPEPKPAPVVVQEPAPRKMTIPAVVSPRIESRRHAPSAPAKHTQARKEVPSREVQEAVIPACSDSDPLCGISKRPH
jgi:hypothetical protein